MRILEIKILFKEMKECTWALDGYPIVLFTHYSRCSSVAVALPENIIKELGT